MTDNVLYNFTAASIGAWQTKLSLVKSGSASARIACIGDSTTQGHGASGNTSNGDLGSRPLSYPSQLANILNAGYVSAQGDSFFGDGNSAPPYPTYDPRVTFGSGWSAFTGGGSHWTAGGNLFVSSSTSPLSFAPSNSVDTIEIYYLLNSAFSVNVDSGSALSTSTGGGAASPAKMIVSCPLGQHTINIVPASSSPVYIIGIHAYSSGSPKVAVLGMGYGGATAAKWVDHTYTWQAMPVLPLIAPDLSIVMLGINDASQNVGEAAFMSSMQTLVTALMSSGSVILMTPGPTDPSIASAATNQAYRDCLYALADKNDLALIDLSVLRGSYSTANAAGFYYDTDHPSGAGYFDIAKTVATAISS